MGKPYILCVDDDKTILMSLKAQLVYCMGDKYRYELAEGVQEAWEVIEDIISRGDELLIIISDWQMPGIKGDAFLIDVHKQYPDIVKIMLTGHADEAAINKAREHANLSACLTKPWKKEELVDVIQTALENA